MRAEFNEFTYAFAIMEELAHRTDAIPRTLPIIPSLREEGRIGGYDLRIDNFRNGRPIFIQFKVCEWMERSNAIGRKSFSDSFYRFKIWSSVSSRQHQLLLDLEREQEGNVWYVAPAFHTMRELSDFYISRKISDYSLWISPTAIGELVKDEQHYVAYIRPKPVFTLLPARKIHNDYAFNAKEAILPSTSKNVSLHENLLKSLESMEALIQNDEGQKGFTVAESLLELNDVLYKRDRQDYNYAARYPSEEFRVWQLLAKVELLARHYFGCATVLALEE